MSQRLLPWLGKLLDVRPQEAQRAALGFLYLLSTIGAFILSRVSRTVLFLERPGYRAELPLTYLTVAVAVATATLIYARIEWRLRRDRLNLATLTLFLAVTLGFRLALLRPTDATYWFYYVWVEVFGTFLVVQFWSFASEIFDTRQAKRLFTVIGAGGVLANVLVGFTIEATVEALGTENLLVLVASCLGVNMVLVHHLAKRSEAALSKATRHRRETHGRERQGARAVLRMPFPRLITVAVFVCYAVSTVIDYQFQTVIGDSIPDKDARSAYLGAFFGHTGIVAGIIQLGFTTRVLQRYGIRAALMTLPCVLATGSCWMFFSRDQALIPITFTKAAENVLRYTLYDSGFHLLYLPLAHGIRGTTKAVADGLVKPLAIGCTGLALVVLTGHSPVPAFELNAWLRLQELSGIALLGIIVWCVLLQRSRSGYMQCLMKSLRRRRLNLETTPIRIQDEAALHMIRQMLRSDRPTDVLHALSLLRFVQDCALLSPDLTALLKHPHEDVRVAAIHHLQAYAPDRDHQRFAPNLQDSSIQVRRSAASALAAEAGESSVSALTHLLADEAVEVRAAALAGLLKNGGREGVFAGATLLDTWLRSDNAEARSRAARVLGDAASPDFHRPILRLLEDDDTQVRRQALGAASRIAHPALLEAAFGALDDPELEDAASAALAAYGPALTPRLCQELKADTSGKPGRREGLCRALGRVGDASACQVLIDCLLQRNDPARRAALRALGQLRRRHPSLNLPRTPIVQSLWNTSQASQRLYQTRQGLGSRGTALLHEALDVRQRETQREVVDLLTLLYPPGAMALIQTGLGSPVSTTRANAIELLDTLLSNDLKQAVLPVFETVSPNKQPTLEDTRSRLQELLQSSDAWIQACTLYAIAALKLRELAPRIGVLLKHPSPICRQSAVLALDRLDAWTIDAKALVDDVNPGVARYTRWVIARRAATPATAETQQVAASLALDVPQPGSTPEGDALRTFHRTSSQRTSENDSRDNPT